MVEWPQCTQLYYSNGLNIHYLATVVMLNQGVGIIIYICVLYTACRML